LIANILLVFAVLGGILALADILMSEQQKRNFSDSLVRAWSYLDDLKRLSFIEALRGHRARLIYFGTGGLLCVALFLYTALFEGKGSIDEYVNAIAIIPGAVGLAYVGFVGPWTLRATRPLPLFGRLLVFALPAILTITFYAAFEHWSNELFRAIPFGLYRPIVLSEIGSAMFLIAVLPFLLATALPLLFAYVGSIALFVAEIVMRRVAEYSKGPILAGSAICGAVAAALKVFGKP
jgi:hypothetical protein